MIRDGGQRQIPAAEVVAGDLLVLAEGDIVPADARVTEAAALLLDESALTGESVPVDKSPGAARDGAAATVSAGTVVVRGRGRAVVTATGTASAMGRIAALMTAKAGLTPLQHRMIGVGRALAVAAVMLCAIVLGLGLARGQSAELMVITAISLVVAAVPESLPRWSRWHWRWGAADDRAPRAHPPAARGGDPRLGDHLGNDKTGTLTEGSMVARRLWTPADEAVISGTGYGPPGQVLQDGRPLDATAVPAVTGLLTAAALCNDAALRPPADGQGWTAVGDSTEAALLAAATRLGLQPEQLAVTMPRVSELPFDSGRKWMTTVHRRPADGVL